MKSSKGRGGKSVAPAKRSPWPLLLGAGALMLVLAGVLLLLRPAPGSDVPMDGLPGEGAAPAAGGDPQLAVDQEVLDFGDVKFNEPVVATFRLTNTGDAPLQILGEPVVAAVEGC